MTTKEQVERFEMWETFGGAHMRTAPDGDWVRFSDYAALLARAEAAEARSERRTYDGKSESQSPVADAYARGREDALREAAAILSEAADYDSDAIAGSALDELRYNILALIKKPEGE